MDNATIVKKIKLTAKLMELHGEDDFKARSYSKVAETLKYVDVDLTTLNEKQLAQLEGIGKSSAQKILQLCATGSFESLDKLLSITPDSVQEMIGISGFGPKKIGQLWKEAGAQSLDELLIKCNQGAISGIKGFGEKSQETLKKAVEFKISNRGYLRYANAEPIYLQIIADLKIALNTELISETAELRRRLDVLNCIDILVGHENAEQARVAVQDLTYLEVDELISGPFTIAGWHKSARIKFKIQICNPISFTQKLILTTGNQQHLNTQLSSGQKIINHLRNNIIDSEEGFYEKLGLQYIVPEMREGTFEIALAEKKTLPNLIEMSDLKGILHNHSTYSDGIHTLRQMAEYCRDLGYGYLGITDHSQTAVYANGLQEFKVQEQQEEIKKLNVELAPFKIFSGIESDILSDGSLDYKDEILSSFDFIVASVHSGLNMDINKATNRLLGAIQNPYTTFLGHMTGRILLERAGYPVDHKTIIDACAKHNVIIEINSSPYRLDIDWRWVHYAIEKGVILSLNPDAHKMKGYEDMKYGLLAGRKGGLTKEMTFNTKTLTEVEKYFSQRKFNI